MTDQTFRPMGEAPDGDVAVLLRFRDPADPDHAPADRLARHETDIRKERRWRFADTLDVLALKDAGGWRWTEPGMDRMTEAADRAGALDDAQAADAAWERDRARNALPWQKRLAAAGRRD